MSLIFKEGQLIRTPYVDWATYDTQVDKFETSIGDKVEKIYGKGLSTYDFNDYYKGVLDNFTPGGDGFWRLYGLVLRPIADLSGFTINAKEVCFNTSEGTGYIISTLKGLEAHVATPVIDWEDILQEYRVPTAFDVKAFFNYAVSLWKVIKETDNLITSTVHQNVSVGGENIYIDGDGDAIAIRSEQVHILGEEGGVALQAGTNQLVITEESITSVAPSIDWADITQNNRIPTAGDVKTFIEQIINNKK